jgi:two-component system sensor histidine kinase/response regulator
MAVENFGSMGEGISAFGRRNVSEIRDINRDLTEKALQMRCQGYLAQAKAKLLSETIVEIDNSKKAIVNDHLRLQQQTKLIAAQKDGLEKITKTLLRSNEDLKNFAHATSHDIRSPITSICMAVGFLREEYQNVVGEDGIKFLDTIDIAADRIVSMLDALVKQSDIGRLSHNFVPVDMNDLIEKQINLYRMLIEQNAATVTHDHLPIVMGDHDLLERLVENILGNALKYRSQKRAPVIHISAIQEGNLWKFSISDNGIGINSDELEKVFDMFHRVDSSSDAPGTGIGLATCRRIVEHLDGEIWVESEIEKGSTFYFTLSISQ